MNAFALPGRLIVLSTIVFYRLKHNDTDGVRQQTFTRPQTDTVTITWLTHSLIAPRRDMAYIRTQDITSMTAPATIKGRRRNLHLSEHPQIRWVRAIAPSVE